MAQIPDNVIEEILAKADIESVVGKYVSFTKRTGQNLFGLCPFHSEKTPSFSVSLNKGIYHCFGCGEHGDHIDFVQKLYGLSNMRAVGELVLPVRNRSAARAMPLVLKDWLLILQISFLIMR